VLVWLRPTRAIERVSTCNEQSSCSKERPRRSRHGAEESVTCKLDSGSVGVGLAKGTWRRSLRNDSITHRKNYTAFIITVTLLLHLVLDPENGGSTILRNVGDLQPKYKLSHLRRHDPPQSMVSQQDVNELHGAWRPLRDRTELLFREVPPSPK
jgi:hypothetical protein